MDDRKVVAAIAAGDPSGITMAYDKYAAALYGYCHWRLLGPEAASEALRETFAVAAGTLSGLPEAPELRPWLYAVARDECQRRLPSTPQVRDQEAAAGRQARKADPAIDAAHSPDDATVQFRAIRPAAADATVQFRAVHEPVAADATVQFRAVHEPAAADATVQFRAVRPAASATLPIDATQPIRRAHRKTRVNRDPDQAELRALTRAVLAALKPDEREVIELNVRHGLYDTDLATALGVSWSQAHGLISRARGQLEKDLGALLIARTGQADCRVLGGLLAGSDGHLTKQTRDLVSEHIEQCAICAGRRRGALRPAVLSGLQPLAVPPSGLRKDVLTLCSPAAADGPKDQPSADPVRPTMFSAVISAMRWDTVRRHPGAATAATAVALWILAAVSVTVLTLTGSHLVHALVTHPSASAPPTSPAAQTAGTEPTAGRTSGSTRPSRTANQDSAYLVPSTVPAPTAVPPSAYLTPSDGTSTTAGGAGHKPSQSAKPSQSPAPSQSSSPPPSASPSPTPPPSSSPPASQSPTPPPSSSPPASQSPTPPPSSSAPASPSPSATSPAPSTSATG